ncbi:unnamed protein product [Didymodactylos carnosus]|uniref:protein-tyrosine-phosphatase n=1 Tax=Didymodactylos carnosus TaxID=1234261 RepID=A0A8S2ESK3_9BILA|nr:unnamed protein product [Didymodactylos carnosus]CAF4069374.1 unnamed protein product [Didymodactylos carnosus]
MRTNVLSFELEAVVNMAYVKNASNYFPLPRPLVSSSRYLYHRQKRAHITEKDQRSHNNSSYLSNISQQNETNHNQNNFNVTDSYQRQQNEMMNNTKPDQVNSTVQEFVSKSVDVMKKEFRKLANPSVKYPSAAREPKNISKNRYRDVIPGDETRVFLLPDELDKDDFINASYVSGYKQAKAYIFAQGPLESTTKDFWRMIWQQKSDVIAMTTNVRENGMQKCFQYWPLEVDNSQTYGMYTVTNDQTDRGENFNITKLTLRKKYTDQSLTVYHCHFTKWPDHGVPSGTGAALEFLEKVRTFHQKTNSKSPIVVHCSAGIGRTGTFCTIDISMRRFRAEKTIDIASTVANMRNERAGSVQTEDQYIFCHLALIDFIQLDEQVQSALNRKGTVVNIVPSLPSFDRASVQSTDTIITGTNDTYTTIKAASITKSTDGDNRDIDRVPRVKSDVNRTSILTSETDKYAEDYRAQTTHDKPRIDNKSVKLAQSIHNSFEGGYIERLHSENDFEVGRLIRSESAKGLLYKRSAEELNNQPQISTSNDINNTSSKPQSPKRQIKVNKSINKNAVQTPDIQQRQYHHVFNEESIDYSSNERKNSKTNRIPKSRTYKPPKVPVIQTNNQYNLSTPRLKDKERTLSSEAFTSSTFIRSPESTNTPVLLTPVFSRTQLEPSLLKADQTFLVDYGLSSKATAPKKQRTSRKPRKNGLRE